MIPEADFTAWMAIKYPMLLHDSLNGGSTVDEVTSMHDAYFAGYNKAVNDMQEALYGVSARGRT